MSSTRIAVERIRENLTQDFRYALRGLRRSPALTITVVITLALGVGANAAVYSFLDRLLVQPPPGVVGVPSLRRVYVNVREGWPSVATGSWFASQSFSYAAYEAIRKAAGPSVNLVAENGAELVSLVVGGSRTPARANWVTPNYFATLGARTERGRLFNAEESRIDVPTNVAVITDAAWRRWFGADPMAIGRTVRIGRMSYTIVGVVAAPFAGAEVSATDVFLPINTINTTMYGSRHWYETNNGQSFALIVNLAPELSEARFVALATRANREANDELNLGEPKIADTVSRVITGPLLQARGPAFRDQSVTIAKKVAGVSLVVLLIACANIATLLLLRATRRRREIAVRLALGVSRGRLALQMLIEGLALATIAAPAALLVAGRGGVLLRALLMPASNWQGGAMNARVAMSAIVGVLTVGVLAALTPAIYATRADLSSALKTGAHHLSTPSRLRSALLLGQSALTVLLLVGAGLFIRSFATVASLPIGYDQDRVLVATVPVQDDDPDQATVTRTMELVASRMRLLAGVRAVGLARTTPMGSTQSWAISIPGRPGPLRTKDAFPVVNNVSPEFFDAAGLRVIDGRSFVHDEHNVVIVDDAMQKAFWPGERAVGKCLVVLGTACTPIIGVVESSHTFRRIERPTLHWYLPTGLPRSILVNVDRPHRASVMKELRRELAQSVAYGDDANIRMMSDDVERELRPWRLYASLFTVFGLLALVVAAIGVYSSVAYAVQQRTHEMGIRVALGARGRDIVNRVLSDGMPVLLTGVAAGLALAVGLSRLIASQLYGVTQHDPFVLLGAACVLVGVGLLASVVPAFRAARVDPMVALREE